jgi:hypothetical protein
MAWDLQKRRAGRAGIGKACELMSGCGNGHGVVPPLVCRAVPKG